VPALTGPDVPVVAGSPGSLRSSSFGTAPPVRGTPGSARAPLALAFGAALSSGALVAAIGLADPFGHHLSPPCPLHALTGLYCPFCGATRATWAVTHLRPGLMLHENALYPALVLLAAWAWLSWLGRATGYWRLPVPRGRTFGLGVAVVLLAFTVLRNLPGFGALVPPTVA
jgi:Protein of unknown function (DUF2752)